MAERPRNAGLPRGETVVIQRWETSGKGPGAISERRIHGLPASAVAANAIGDPLRDPQHPPRELVQSLPMKATTRVGEVIQLRRARHSAVHGEATPHRALYRTPTSGGRGRSPPKIRIPIPSARGCGLRHDPRGPGGVVTK